jgi:hypothetical protein
VATDEEQQQEVIIKLYQTPDGKWSGTEKDWKADMKAEGHDAAAIKAARKLVEIPTSKPELIEFLTFHNINIVNPQHVAASHIAPTSDLPPSPASGNAGPSTTVPDLDGLFQAAPLRTRLDLAVTAIDAATEALQTPRAP